MQHANFSEVVDEFMAKGVRLRKSSTLTFRHRLYTLSQSVLKCTGRFFEEVSILDHQTVAMTSSTLSKWQPLSSFLILRKKYTSETPNQVVRMSVGKVQELLTLNFLHVTSNSWTAQTYQLHLVIMFMLLVAHFSWRCITHGDTQSSSVQLGRCGGQIWF